MKNTITALQWTCVILVIVFTFVFFWQKQQNEYTGITIEKAFENAQQKIEAREITQVPEHKSMPEQFKDGIRSMIAFVISIFTKG